MSNKLINKFSFFLLCFILSFYSSSQSSYNIDKFKIQNWIENIPILSSLIENKRDVVEFDSSNGKIISISFDTKNLSKKQIFSFYINFFEEKKWKKNENENVWETKNKTFKKKIFKIENFEDNVLKIKIIVENF
ncbi:MAG: hypothetical protein EVA21_02315 [Alphaproteobacteria bacterium]|nr:MAG: hypothetical protein EVA21_02315 [Alphaproteobacteria bacterium]|tara:strand:+ start:40 stop:441 length:402 start_codon:yes stop_codon:yes gene_type:complete